MSAAPFAMDAAYQLKPPIQTPHELRKILPSSEARGINPLANPRPLRHLCIDTHSSALNAIFLPGP